ncbi:hypothetical protein, partial [Sphingobacterium luzhongxinii]|uniref:hypothetical protein n=1 Tax=Sphingobacterium luzhongxinii TaxID=2654181 RepID=UPI001F095E38
MNIKNFALTGLLLSSVVIANAQQKLSDGTGDNGLTVNQNAILELASKNKGLLHTRVTLEATTKAYPMSAHVAGLMVYNTETRNDVIPGIYYNDGTKWVLASGGKATSISYNPTTYEISFVDVNGNPVTIDFKQVVKVNETVTMLTPLGQGKYEYISENGTKTTINVPSDVIQNFETIVKEENVNNAITNLIKNVGGNVYYDGAKFTYVTNTGETKEITIKEIIKGNETITTLVDNKDGTITYNNEEGEPVTIDLKTGPAGLNGKSAYEVALENGFVGTKAEWLLSLVGATGANGKSALEVWQGLPGNDGKDGADFIAAITGQDGTNGVDGKSAYEV